MLGAAYLLRRHRPDFEVVRSHEQICDSSTHHTDDPLIERLRFWWVVTSFECGVNHAINALDLLLLRQHGNVVLERVGNPLVLAANI